jgi:hypothetical protein
MFSSAAYGELHAQVTGQPSVHSLQNENRSAASARAFH